MKQTILFLFNSSLYAPQPWLDDGRYNCVSVDYDETDHSGQHRPLQDHPRHWRLNVDLSRGWVAFDEINELCGAYGLAWPSLVVSFAPCTDLAGSGAKHFAKKALKDPQFQERAVEQAQLATLWECPYVVENPVGRLSTLWRKPNVYVHPSDFGGLCPAGPHPEFPDVIPERDAYNKKTGLWWGQGFNAPQKDPVEVIEGANPGWAKLGGKSARTKYIRSLTPRGLAKAIYLANRGERPEETVVECQLELDL